MATNNPPSISLSSPYTCVPWCELLPPKVANRILRVFEELGFETVAEIEAFLADERACSTTPRFGVKCRHDASLALELLGLKVTLPGQSNESLEMDLVRNRRLR